MYAGTEPVAIYSEFDGDPEMGELIEMFVAELPDRIETMVAALGRGDFETLQYAAHQLKGAVGSYGFHQLTPQTTKVDALAKQPTDEQQICKAVQELVEQCQRVRTRTQ